MDRLIKVCDIKECIYFCSILPQATAWYTSGIFVVWGVPTSTSMTVAFIILPSLWLRRHHSTPLGIFNGFVWICFWREFIIFATKSSMATYYFERLKITFDNIWGHVMVPGRVIKNRAMYGLWSWGTLWVFSCYYRSDSGVVNLYHGDYSSNISKPSTIIPLKSFLNLTTRVDHISFNHDSQIMAIGSKRNKDSLRLVCKEAWKEARGQK